MPPAASEESSRQNTRLPGDNSEPSQDPIRLNQEQDSSGKSKKKGKNGSKGKDKGVKPAAQASLDELAQPSPPSQSEPSSYPNNAFTRPANNVVVSPVLEALSSLGNNPENETAYRTGAWAKSIPFGKSPPNDVVDTGFASSPLSFPNNAERGGFGHVSSSASPPTARPRPMSYGNGQLSITHSRHQSVDQKRHSMGGQFQSQPPLPHLPQAHFYGAPEIDLPSFPAANKLATDKNHSFCAFDSIPGPPFKAGRMGGKVLVVGTDGGLDVLAIEDHKTRLIGKITGLNGRVLDAKLLPYNSQSDPYASSRPHVAVIVHGPVTHKDDGGGSCSAGSEPNEILPGLPGRTPPHERQQSKDEAVYYQTRVEVYSLRTGDHITTLFTTKLVPCFDNFPNLSLYAPAPVGNLKLYASGNYIVVASGISGEVFIYGVIPSAAPNAYQCLAKTWTSVQSRDLRRYSNSSSSTDQDGSQADGSNGAASSDSPIISLSGRWLAVVPPSFSSRAPPLGTVPAHLVQRKVHGLETHIPPSKPAVTCATDSGEGESLFNKVARGVTQELFRGARWMGDQGLQAWNNYWNKDQQSGQNGNLRRTSQFADAQQQGHNLFPPTHGQDTAGMSSSEPDLVSVIDIKKLEDGQETKTSFPGPVATFQAPNGCSFLSFSPNGLMLLTASKKGDVQYVWDLMQIKHCRAAAFLSDDLTVNGNSNTIAPHIRQVSRYARLTTSSIVDVIWTHPTGEKLAIITRKGTVHVFDIPRSAFQWPPFRRARPMPINTQAEDSAAISAGSPQSEESGSANPFTAAMKFVGGKTQPILAAVRVRAPSVGPAFPVVTGFGISSAAGVRGSKAVAAGLSKSVGAATGTVKTLRHVGENRLHLSGFSRDPVASRVTWICTRDECLLGVIESGCFKLYKIKRSAVNHKTRRNQSVIGPKVMEFKLPPYLQNTCGPLQLGFFTDSAVNASWALPSTAPHSSSATKLKSQPLSQAEIETNAPYQPFHTDRRVSLHVFSESGAQAAAPSAGQWVFGNDIPTQKLHVRPLSPSDDEDVLPGQSPGLGEMENLITLGNGSDQVEEVVITTRRKKKHLDPLSATSPGVDDDDGFFEDDCDVLDFARDRV
ncbi:hypothetical protein VTN77DRAFT_4116 [Rasamsonia byssochlamydoides]|uniref:uncharacterized protein n=1 Tax=Rasamsonia byssochlamydoides TaxID=89139 RepID=UPI0037421D2C